MADRLVASIGFDQAVTAAAGSAGVTQVASAPRYFTCAAAFRRWLDRHHAHADELWVGFHKVASGKPSMTWPQSVDEALCFGWIDGVRKSLGDDAYVIRFTPRRARSKWSRINLDKVNALQAEGRMTPAGLAAWQARDGKDAGYSYESLTATKATAAFDRAAALQRFQAEPEAWRFWLAQPPGWRRRVTWWVTSAKQAATRERRLTKVIAAAAAGRRVD